MTATKYITLTTQLTKPKQQTTELLKSKKKKRHGEQIRLVNMSSKQETNPSRSYGKSGEKMLNPNRKGLKEIRKRRLKNKLNRNKIENAIIY